MNLSSIFWLVCELVQNSVTSPLRRETVHPGWHSINGRGVVRTCCETDLDDAIEEEKTRTQFSLVCEFGEAILHEIVEHFEAEGGGG